MITLRTENGHYLMADPHGWLTAATPERTALNLFELVELGGGAIALRTISPAKYVCIRDGQVCAATEDSQACEQFTLCDQGEGRVALKTAAGQFLCAEDGGAVTANSAEAGPWETFQLERLPDLADALNAQTDCCGLSHGGRRRWEDHTHHWLVESAVAILLHHKATLPQAQGFAFFWNNAAFQQNVFKGLRDADYVSPYRDTFFSCHFYDPDNGTNILGHKNWTAFTQCVEYFARSRERALQIEKGQDRSDAAFGEAGYELGLSLHYLTDLTQPMHAANFANLLPTLNVSDWRHSKFEQYAESIMEQEDKARALKVAPASVSVRDLTAPDFNTIGELVDNVARHAKKVFVDYVKGPADAKVHIIPGPTAPSVVIVSEWTAAEADPAIKAAVPYAQKMAARYLLEWVSRTVSVSPYLPAGMRLGHTGRWRFSENGKPGSWFPGNSEGGKPSVTLLADNGFRLEGAYNFAYLFKKYEGTLGVAVTKMQSNGACKVTVHGQGTVGNFFGPPKFYIEEPATYRLNSDDREIVCTGKGLSLSVKVFPGDLLWAPGVQIRFEMGGAIRHLCFEDLDI